MKVRATEVARPASTTEPEGERDRRDQTVRSNGTRLRATRGSPSRLLARDGVRRARAVIAVDRDAMV